MVGGKKYFISVISLIMLIQLFQIALAGWFTSNHSNSSTDFTIYGNSSSALITPATSPYFVWFILSVLLIAIILAVWFFVREILHKSAHITKGDAKMEAPGIEERVGPDSS